MRQVKASVGDDVVAKLEQSAQKSGKSLSEEIRERLEGSFDDVRPDVAAFLHEIRSLVAWTERETGHRWNQHRSATAVLQHAIYIRLLRAGAASVSFDPNDLPAFGELAPGMLSPDAIAQIVEALSRKFPEAVENNSEGEQPPGEG